MSYEVNVQIVGIAPMAHDPLSVEVMEQIEKGSTGGRKSAKQKEEIGSESYYKDEKGYLCVPKRNIKKMLMQGVQKAGLKYGRGSLVPYVEATVFVKEATASLGVKKPDFIEKFPVKRLDGKTIIKIRPGLNPGWKLNFTLLVIDERRDSEQLKVALQEAGVLVGLCAGRPEYGRFEVTKWEVVK